MEEIILKICPDMSVVRVPFPQGKTDEVYCNLTNLIRENCFAFDDYSLDNLSSITKHNVVLLTDFFPERNAKYNRIGSLLLANFNQKQRIKGMPVWGNALLVRKTLQNPNDRFHFSLGGFSGICLDMIELYVMAIQKKFEPCIMNKAENIENGKYVTQSVDIPQRKRNVEQIRR